LRKVNHAEVFSAVRRAIFDIHELQVHAIALLRTASILKTSSGKIQRQACKAQYLDDSFPIVASFTQEDEGGVAQLRGLPTGFSADSAQHWIMQWVARKFGRNLASIDPRHSFDACGMDSLSAVEFAHDLGAMIGRGIDEITVWNYPTIETLSTYVAQLNGTGKVTPEPRTLSKPAVHYDASLEELGEKELVDLLYDEIEKRRTEG
jgi:acyl carrier protein